MHDDCLRPITGATRLLGFLGDPVVHAKSPQNINPLLARAGRDAVLVPLHVRAAEFEAAIGGILAIANLDGVIATMPFKERLMARMDVVSERARAIGAINAGRRMADGRWEGDIFDGDGLIAAVEGLGTGVRGKRVGLLGAGGAGSAIAFALADAGAGSLAIHDRQQERAQKLCDRVAALRPLKPVAGPFAAAGLDLLIHATPVGMDPQDGLPLDVTDLSARTAVVDIVTRPGTPLLQAAAARGCPHAGGAAMVKGQAAAMLGFFGLA